MEVPASVDGPHLIYRNDYFGAPVRNDSDTVWMKERQIEAMYRARFDERRHATEALDALSAEASAGRDSGNRAWFVGVAHPRIPRVLDRLTREAARQVLSKTEALALTFAGRRGIHPLESVDWLNPRPGLRRWVAVSTVSEHLAWREVWVSIHHDGSVTVVAAIGGHPDGQHWGPDGLGHFEGWEVASTAIECAIADLMALLRATAETAATDEYDVRVGIEWSGAQPLVILTQDNMGHTYRDASTPLHRYTPIETTVNAQESQADFFWHVHDLAQDCVNQGGISNVLLIQPPTREDEA